MVSFRIRIGAIVLYSRHVSIHCVYKIHVWSPGHTGPTLAGVYNHNNSIVHLYVARIDSRVCFNSVDFRLIIYERPRNACSYMYINNGGL